MNISFFKENIVNIEFNGTRTVVDECFHFFSAFTQIPPKQACFYLLYGRNIHIIGHSL